MSQSLEFLKLFLLKLKVPLEVSMNEDSSNNYDNGKIFYCNKKGIHDIRK